MEPLIHHFFSTQLDFHYIFLQKMKKSETTAITLQWLQKHECLLVSFPLHSSSPSFFLFLINHFLSFHNPFSTFLSHSYSCLVCSLLLLTYFPSPFLSCFLPSPLLDSSLWPFFPFLYSLTSSPSFLSSLPFFLLPPPFPLSSLSFSFLSSSPPFLSIFYSLRLISFHILSLSLLSSLVLVSFPVLSFPLLISFHLLFLPWSFSTPLFYCPPLLSSFFRNGQKTKRRSLIHC